ncbi:MAG: hypothetical protein EPO21_17725 [Chloroflexota bacterium]|nr:MAG: hypothetical protein EPO21_17725 [Chloroflexota bacterium]
MNNRTTVLVLVAMLAIALLLGACARVSQEQERQSPSAVAGATAAATSAAIWYELRFTTPRYPDDPAIHRGGLDARLVQLMDQATKTMDVADYDFDLANVADAMARAKQRGVIVRMVTDSDTLNDAKNKQIQAAFDTLRKANIPIVDDQRQEIMHNKFTVVDGEWVETGSWNYTDGDTYRLNNNLVILRSPELARNYTDEFDKMFVKRQFGPKKDKGVPFPSLRIEGVKVENYFAPEDDVANRIIATLQQSSTSIHFMAFSFTHDGIGQTVRDKARAGVKVTGVFETTGSNTSYSEYTRMKQEGLDVYQDGNPYAMHHKVFVVDGRLTILGSFNFSENADRGNDENLLIVDDPTFAKAFEDEFGRVLEQAKNPPERKKR